MNDEIVWRTEAFDQLPLSRLYTILAARMAVFVVEQDCPYQDIDGLDGAGVHVSAWSGDSLLAYARVLPPGEPFAEPSIGRVLTTLSARRSGLGRELMQRCVELTDRRFPQQAVRIAAQHYLEAFYSGLGFETVSAPYLEDGIPHIEMLRCPDLEEGEG